LIFDRLGEIILGDLERKLEKEPQLDYPSQ
jgi:hypothetical protein